MANIKVENIVYNITTQSNELEDALDTNSTKVRGLDADVQKTSKNSQAAFDKMGQSAKAYGEKIAQAEREQQRLKNTIREQEQITQEFKNELLQVEQRLKGVGRNTVEFQKLTQKANELKAAIKDNNVALNGMRVNKRNIDASIKDMQRLQNEAKKVQTSTKGAKGGISEFGSALGTLSPQVGGTVGQFSGLLSSLGSIGPLGLAAAAGLAAVGGAFFLATDRLEEFDDKVENVTERIKLGFNRAGDSIAQGFAQLFSEDGDIINKAENFYDSLNKAITQGSIGLFGADAGTAIGFGVSQALDPRNYINLLLRPNQVIEKTKSDLEDVVKLRIEEKKAQEDLQKILDFQRQQEDIEIANIVKKTKLEIEAAKARAEFEESRTDGIRNQGAFNRLVQAETDLYNLQKQEKKAILQIEQQINKLTLSRADTEGRREQELEADLLRLEAQFANTQKSFEKLRRFLNSSKDEQRGLIQDIKNQIAETEKLLNTTYDVEKINEYKTRIAELNKELQQLLTINPVLGFSQQLQKDISELQNKIATSPDFNTAITFVPELTKKQEELKDFNNALAELARRASDPAAFARENNPLALLAGLDITQRGIDAQVSEVYKRLQKSISDNQKEQAAQLLGKQQIEDEAANLLQVYGQLSQDILRTDIERTDRQIELQRQRVSEFQKIAENGNAEQLQLEEERLKGLLERRERYAQRERAISALLIAASNAEAIASGISAVAKGFSGPGAPFTGIANAIALAATIGSTIVALRNATSSLPAFAEGTEYVPLNGAPKGKDTILARLNEGERVLTTEQNAKLRGISNAKLVEIASEYKLNNMRMKNVWAKGSQKDNSAELISGINRTNRLLEGLNLYADVNEYGLQMGINRAERNIIRRRNLAR